MCVCVCFDSCQLTGTRYGILTTTLGYDTGRKGFIAEAVNKYKKTEVEVEYSDITKAVVASGSVRANASNKFAARYLLPP